MLVLQTSKRRGEDEKLEWINISINGVNMRVTAKISPMANGKLKDRVVIVFDAPREVLIIRDKVIKKSIVKLTEKAVKELDFNCE